MAKWLINNFDYVNDTLWAVAMTTDIGTSVGEFIDTATDNFVQNRFKIAFFV